MSKLADIENLKIAMAVMEEKLIAVRAGLHSVEKDIDMLSTHEAQLAQNIRYLKKKKVIALASEYKKIREELQIVNNKLELLRNDRENFRTVYVRSEMELIKLMDEVDRLINNPGGTVIEADFRRHNGR